MNFKVVMLLILFSGILFSYCDCIGYCCEEYGGQIVEKGPDEKCLSPNCLELAGNSEGKIGCERLPDGSGFDIEKTAGCINDCVFSPGYVNWKSGIDPECPGYVPPEEVSPEAYDAQPETYEEPPPETGAETPPTSGPVDTEPGESLSVGIPEDLPIDEMKEDAREFCNAALAFVLLGIFVCRGSA